MMFNYLFGLMVYVVTALISLTMIVYFLVSPRKNALILSFVFFQFMAFLWVLRALLWFLFMNFYYTPINILKLYDILNFKLGFFIGGFIGLSFLVFSLNYIGWKFSNNRLFILVLCLPVSFFYIMCLVNENTSLTYFNGWGVLGIWFWLYSFTAYLYCILGMIVLIFSAFRKKGNARKEVILLILSLLVPLLFSSVSDLGVMFFNKPRLLGAFDFVPEGFSISLVIIAFITFRYRFLNIRAFAQNEIVYNLNQAVIIVDEFNTIINYNKLIQELFSYSSIKRARNDINSFITALKKHMPEEQIKEEIIDKIIGICDYEYNTELILFENRRSFELNIRPVFDNEKFIGRIISFNDITRYKDIANKLNEKNKDLLILNDELLSKNYQLLEYTRTAEELAVIKERDRLSRDIHDTMGHTMTAAITQLKVARILCESNPEQVKYKLDEIMHIVKEGLNELRASIKGLTPSKLKDSNFEEAIRKLVTEFESSGIMIDFTVNGQNSDITTDYVQVLYRLCQEALTNAVRHGKAEHVDIVINFSAGKVKVFIQDNGIGCKEIKKGFGLIGMEHRVKNLNGKIEYGSDGENGFNLFIEIPINNTDSSKSSEAGI